MIKTLAIPFLCLPVCVMADISDEANACIDTLRDRVGNVGGEIIEQSGSEAGTYVLLRDANGSEYECIVWSGPAVADFREVGSASTTENASTSAPTVAGVQRVSFASGTSGTVMSATLQAETSVQYVLGASTDQFLNVDIGSHGGALDYKITNPDGSALLDLISSETPYRGQLWQSGDHIVEVLNAGAQAVIFDVGIGIE